MHVLREFDCMFLAACDNNNVYDSDIKITWSTVLELGQKGLSLICQQLRLPLLSFLQLVLVLQLPKAKKIQSFY